MLWEDALDRIISEDARRAEMEKAPSIKRDAIRQRWMMKTIQKLDEEYEQEEMRAMVGLFLQHFQSLQLS